MKDLVIVGAGGHGREILQCITDINAEAPQWNVLGFVDDNSESSDVEGLSVLGGMDWLTGKDCHIIVAIGAPAVRRRVVRRLESNGAVRFATLVHPSAQVGKRVSVGAGSMVCAAAVVTTDITIGRHVIVNTASVVSHDCHLGDFSTLAPCVCLCGGVKVGEGAELGAACTVVPSIQIGEWSLIGAGAVVIASVAANTTAVGVPASTIKKKTAGWQEQS